jgi:hypothetical protein
MAQTSQSEETGKPIDTTAPGSGRPPGLFGGSTTILLIVLAVAVFWWNRRRRIEMEERLRAQRREAEAVAERSALDVAHLMRSGAGSATAGLASAATAPFSRVPPYPAGAAVESPVAAEQDARESDHTAPAGGRQDVEALAIDRAEAHAAAERAAEEQAARAAQDAQTAGESPARRHAAAKAAAEEAEVDAAEVARAARTRVIPEGAVAGDGSANCPSDYPIKGNGQSHIYHTPGQVSYRSTIAEFCFASAEAAERAGFRVSRAREQRSPQ